MIKWPEPDTHCIEAYTVMDVWSHSTEQLKQAVRDALTLTIQRLNGNTYNLTKAECVEEIRALIKEIT